MRERDMLLDDIGDTHFAIIHQTLAVKRRRDQLAAAEAELARLEAQLVAERAALDAYDKRHAD